MQFDNVNDLWESSRARCGDRLALVGSKTRFTYREVGELVDDAAAVLRDMGVGPGVKVALFLPNDPSFVVAFMAVLKAGAVVCHIDPFLSAREMPRVLSLIQPDLAVFGDLVHKQVHLIRQLVPAVEMDGTRFEKIEFAVPPRDPEPILEGVAGLFCTSGTTGIPKAVMLTHRNLTSNIASLLEHGNWHDHEVFGNPLPVWHISGAIVFSLLPIAMGATVVYLRRATPEAILRMVEKERITRFGGVPHIYAMLNRFRHRDRFDVTSCRSWITGAAPLPEAVEEEFEEKFPGRIRHVYGMLEASPGIASTLDEGDYTIGQVGKPLPGVDVQIRNAADEPLTVGKIGKVFVRAPNITRGYYRNPEATRQTIRDGWLDTGDMGFLDPQGRLQLSGRFKEMMIVAGQNVYPTEIETTLLEHQAVADAGVTSIEHAVRGEEILAFVVLSDGQEFEERPLIDYCRAQLATYKVPRRVYVAQTIPRNETGKILRDLLLREVPVTVAGEG